MSGHKVQNDTFDLPEDVSAVFANFHTGELTNIGKKCGLSRPRLNWNEWDAIMSRGS